MFSRKSSLGINPFHILRLNMKSKFKLDTFLALYLRFQTKDISNCYSTLGAMPAKVNFTGVY